MVRIKHRWLLVQILYPTEIRKPVGQQNMSSSTSLLAAPAPSLALHAPTPDSVTSQSLIRLLRAQLNQLFGDYGAGLTTNGLIIKYWSNATSTMIVRCERAAVRLVWAALTFVRSLSVQEGKKSSELPCVMQVLRVSGTIRKAEEELLRRNKALCGRLRGLSLAAEAGVGADGVVDLSDEDGGEAMDERSDESDTADGSDDETEAG